MLLIIIIVRGKNGRQWARTEKLGAKIWSYRKSRLHKSGLELDFMREKVMRR